MKTAGIAIALLTAGAIGISGTSYAQKKGDFGKYEYDTDCAVCHGKVGNGLGPYTGMLNTRIPDLTILAKNNNGVFPFQRVYEVIDGRQPVKAHGPSDMPIWGDRYVARAREFYWEEPYSNVEDVVRARILALTEYVNRMQAK
jgi:mono/diheme cytochrome c family protein